MFLRTLEQKLMLAAVVMVATAFGAAYMAGRSHGYDKHAAEVAEETRKLNERLDAATKRAREAEADLSAVRMALKQTEMERENEARSDPDADSPGLGAGSLQRLDSIGRN
jgi:glycerol kinase